jgi:hypothetical protein
VWLDIRAGFAVEESLQFYCDPTTTPDGWHDRGYVISFWPENAQITRSMYLVFEIDPAQAQGAFVGRYAERGSNEWTDLPTVFDEGTLRVYVELDESLPIFAYPGQFVTALFVELPTRTPSPTFTHTPKAIAPPTSTRTPIVPTATKTPYTALPTQTPLPPVPTPSPPAGTGRKSGLLLLLGLLAVVVIAVGILLIVFMSRSRKRDHQPADAARLILVRGQARPSSIALSRPVTRVGRSPKGNDVVVNDPPVSGQHAEIRSKEGRHAIRDLNSTNGTFVNGQRLTQLRPLRDGDRITMGNTEWQYRRGSGTESIPIR